MLSNVAAATTFALTLVKLNAVNAVIVKIRPRLALGEAMSSTTDGSSQSPDKIERPPFMQRVLDNPFLLLFLGVTIPTVFYIIWGVMEIAQIPIAQ